LPNIYPSLTKNMFPLKKSRSAVNTRFFNALNVKNKRKRWK
jgi:hypothetical protein